MIIMMGSKADTPAHQLVFSLSMTSMPGSVMASLHKRTAQQRLSEASALERVGKGCHWPVETMWWQPLAGKHA